MTEQTSFAHLRKVLEQLLSLLKEFENDFNLLIQRFDENISYLYENQDMKEKIFDEYKSTYLDSLISVLLDIQTRIQEEDIPFIEKQVDYISAH